MVPSSPTVCYDALDPPVGGIFVLEISLMPLSQKPVQKRFLPQNGVAFLTEDVFEKKIQVRERIPLSALVPAHMAAPLPARQREGGRDRSLRTLPAPGQPPGDLSTP